MKGVLITLTAFVLLVSSFTLSSCKKCSKDKPDGRYGKTPDTKTSIGATGDGGTTVSGEDLVSTQAPAGNSTNTTDSSGGGSASATNPDGGLVSTAGSGENSSSGGSSLSPPTPAELKALEVAARAKIEKAGDRDLGNPFFKAHAMSDRACDKAKETTAEKEYLERISNMYASRIQWVRELWYDTSVRKKANRDDSYRTEAERYKKKAEIFKDLAEKSITKIMKDNIARTINKSKPKQQKLILFWMEFKAVQKKADEMWQELCDAVDTLN